MSLVLTTSAFKTLGFSYRYAVMVINIHMYLFAFFRPPHIKDLEALEPAFYNSLLWIQENDPEPLDLTFTVEEVGCLIVRTCTTTTNHDYPYPDPVFGGMIRQYHEMYGIALASVVSSVQFKDSILTGQGGQSKPNLLAI